MNKKIILIGGGCHAKCVIDAILCSGDIPVGVLDSRYRELDSLLGVPVLGDISDWAKYTEYEFVICLGNNTTRKKIAESMDVKWHTVIHPKATVSRFATVMEGSMILAGAVINPCAVIGKHCIINTGAIVEHDCVLSDYIHLCPASTLSGTVKVGENTTFGTGTKVSNNLTVCGNCIFGVGTAVIKSITEPGVYVGVPSRKLR